MTFKNKSCAVTKLSWVNNWINISANIYADTSVEEH